MSAPQPHDAAESAPVRAGLSDEQYIAAEELAKVLNVSTKTILRWAKDEPSMPTFRRGKVLRFPRNRVLVWLRDQEQGVPRHRRARIHRSLDVPQRPTAAPASNSAS